MKTALLQLYRISRDRSADQDPKTHSDRIIARLGNTLCLTRAKAIPLEFDELVASFKEAEPDLLASLGWALEHGLIESRIEDEVLVYKTTPAGIAFLSWSAGKKRSLAARLFGKYAAGLDAETDKAVEKISALLRVGSSKKYRMTVVDGGFAMFKK